MIPLLLWRCPLCATNDALVHLERWFRPDLVRCRACQAEWLVRRVPGDNFYLRLVRAESGVGDERSITAWYDAMKQSVRLVPINVQAAAWPASETLYLASGRVELQAEANDPLFFSVPQSLAASRLDKRQLEGKPVGQGRLFLGSHHLVWQGDDSHCVFSHTRLDSAFALLNYGLMLMIERRLYTVYFLEESPLKWIMYLALVARQVEAETGHRIATSHF
jgi:hypothetical protein